jgi:tetratricopeptide (TPR) repeat protein
MEDSALDQAPRDAATRRSNEQPGKAATGSRKSEPRSKSNPEAASQSSDEGQRAKSRGRQQRPAKKRVFALLAEVKVASQDSRFAQALGAFREAANLSQGVRSLREIAFDTAVEEAEQLLPENWRVAEALLGELSLLHLDREVPASLSGRVERAAHDEAIANVINRVKLGGDVEENRVRLRRAIRLYPGEAVLEMHLKSISVAGQDVQPPTGAQNGSHGVVVESTEAEPSVSEEAGVQPEAPVEEPPVETKPAEDSAQPEVLAQVKALLETGPLDEALRACKIAGEKFPHSPGLWVLAKAIREKEEEIRLLVEKGERDLSQLNLRAAREAFLQASGLVPLDHALRTGIANKLHARARTELENDWRSAEALLALSDRISPGRFVPPDLAQALAEKKRQASPEAPPKAGSETIIDVEVLGYTEATGKPRGPRKTPSPASLALLEIDPHPIRRILKRVAAYGVLAATLASLAMGIVVWHPWVKRRASRQPLHVFEIPPREVPSGRAHVPSEATTGTLTIHSNVPDVEVFIDDKKYAQPKGAQELALTLPPATYLVRAVRPGYDDSAPVVASVLTGINREINVFLALKSISPDSVQTERQDWEQAAAAKTFASFEEFVRKHPAGANVPAAKDAMQDLQWPYIDQSDPQVLEAFLSKYPDGLRSKQAREQLELLGRKNDAGTSDQNDWVATNKSDKAALAAYLAKHPSGVHAAQATRFIAELNRWAAAAPAA